MKPKYLFDKRYRAWNTLQNKLLDLNIPIFIFLDYDGTIVPIQEKPKQAKLPESSRLLLDELAQHPNTYVGIVSGRSMKDIRRMVKLTSLFYIANHGYEIYSRKIKWRHPIVTDIVPILKKLRTNFKKALKAIHGVLIENKIITLSIHYRQLSGTLVSTLKKIIKSKMQEYSRFLKISSGKKVFEIKPKNNWNKGKAIFKVMDLFNATTDPLIIYIGDDKTDEDAFRLLPKGAFAIYVGSNSSSKAKYFLNDPNEVILFLKKLNHSLVLRKEM
ncbi:MAG: trehalose-phosphatase [Bacteroidota bacterium]|nr:trehalose-phosphatase [Bacteroidota bacterium]